MKIATNKKILKRISSYPMGTLFKLRDGQTAELYAFDGRDIQEIARLRYESSDTTSVWSSDEPYNGRHNKGLQKSLNRSDDVIEVL